MEDLKSIALRTMENLVDEFTVFLEGKPLECLSGLGPSIVFFPTATTGAFLHTSLPFFEKLLNRSFHFDKF